MKTKDENEERYATVSHEAWDLWRVLMWMAFRLIDAVLYIATLIRAHLVIPAKAGIQKKPGFRVKPGMTAFIRLMSPCIDFFVLN